MTADMTMPPLSTAATTPRAAAYVADYLVKAMEGKMITRVIMIMMMVALIQNQALGGCLRVTAQGSATCLGWDTNHRSFGGMSQSDRSGISDLSRVGY